MGSAASISLDPWRAHSDSECLRLVKEEQGESVIIECLNDAKNIITTASKEGPVRIIADSIDMSDDTLSLLFCKFDQDVNDNCLITPRIVSLNVSGNGLATLAMFNKFASLRQLTVGGNPLNKGPPMLIGFSHLIDLDLSYTSSMDLNGMSYETPFPFNDIGQTLLRLNLTCCELTSLTYGTNKIKRDEGSEGEEEEEEDMGGNGDGEVSEENDIDKGRKF
jgi:hypothetical protein